MTQKEVYYETNLTKKKRKGKRNNVRETEVTNDRSEVHSRVSLMKVAVGCIFRIGQSKMMSIKWMNQ